jgi:hypothetical protein
LYILQVFKYIHIIIHTVKHCSCRVPQQIYLNFCLGSVIKSFHEVAGKVSNREPPYRSKITAGHRSGQRTDSRKRRRREDKGKHNEKSQAGQVKEETRTWCLHKYGQREDDRQGQGKDTRKKTSMHSPQHRELIKR